MTRPARAAIGERATELRWMYIGLMLSLPVLLDPEQSLAAILNSRFGLGPDVPCEIFRSDGSLQSSTKISTVLAHASSLRGDILKEDLLTFAAMHGAVRVGDMLAQGSYFKQDDPLLQFGRHLRNACAHGNRWHFRAGEPRYPARLRGLVIDPSLHGTRALFGNVAPGDYLDYLDDLSARMSSPP
jgi:hypothetical protein